MFKLSYKLRLWMSLFARTRLAPNAYLVTMPRCNKEQYKLARDSNSFEIQKITSDRSI